MVFYSFYKNFYKKNMPYKWAINGYKGGFLMMMMMMMMMCLFIPQKYHKTQGKQ